MMMPGSTLHEDSFFSFRQELFAPEPLLPAPLTPLLLTWPA